jgi:hypothetical protein
MSLAATLKSPLLTPCQWRHLRVAANDSSLAATLLSPLMSFLFFNLIFSNVISGDPKVAAIDPSSTTTSESRC